MKKENTKLVSIIVPCYNQGEYLAETLDSVLAQTYQNWECIIINDGSTDYSEQIAQTYCNKDSRIHYYNQDNQGLSMARNNGIRHCHGDYILPLDADDIIYPEYIALAVAVLDERSEIKIVYCRAEFFGARTGEWKLQPFSLQTLLANNCIFCSAMYRRKDYDATKGYNTNMRYGWEDWDFWLSMLEHGGAAYLIPKILFRYRKKEQSMLVDLEKDDNKTAILYKQVVQNHPLLYYNEYLRLYSMTQSRSYKLAAAYQRIARKIYFWIGK